VKALPWGVLSLLMPLFALADSAQSSEEQYAFVRGEVSRWSEARSVFVGPTLIEEATVQLLQATLYLCYTPDARCEKLRDRAVQHQVITAYLDDLLANPSTTPALMPRFFTAAGSSLRDIGWPNDGVWFNRYVVVARPQALSPPSQALYLHWNGVEAIPVNRTRLALPLGLHSLQVQGTQGPAAEVIVRAARTQGNAVLLTVGQRMVSGGLGATPARIEPQLDRYCLDKPVDPSEPMYRLSAPAGPGQQDAPRPSDFHAADVVNVALIGTLSGCDSACQRWIGIQIVQALSQWRAGCGACLRSTLSAVRIAGDLYVADRFVHWMEFIAETPHADPKNNPYRMQELLTAGGGVNATMGFQRVQDTPLLSALCATASAEDALSSNARSQICATSGATCTPANGCLRIPVYLTGSADCKGFLACGSPDHSVSVNTAEFQFAGLPAAAAMLIGTPSPLQHNVPVPLYPVLLHEVGHWFGLPHVDPDVGPDGRDEVMKATGGTDKVCISRAALNMVSSAVNENWPFRLKVRGGLRYAPN